MCLTHVHLVGIKEVVDCKNARRGKIRKIYVPIFGWKTPSHLRLHWIVWRRFSCNTLFQV